MGKRLTNCPCCRSAGGCTCCTGELPDSVFINVPAFTCVRCASNIITGPEAWGNLGPIFAEGISVECMGFTACQAIGTYKARVYCSDLIYDETALQNALAGQNLDLGLASVTVYIDAQCADGVYAGFCFAEAHIQIKSLLLAGPALYGIENSVLWNQFLADMTRVEQALNTSYCYRYAGRFSSVYDGVDDWYQINLGKTFNQDPNKGFTAGRCSNFTLHHNYMYNANNINNISPYPFPDIVV